MRARLVAAAASLVVAAILVWTAVPGVFTIDEDSYVATIVGLRDGSFRLPHTAGLPPSPELLSFDAAPKKRVVAATPVAPNFPPLYAVYALPFSVAGLRGLIALQVLAYLACAWLVFGVVRRETGRTDLAGLAAGAFAIGSFAIEYAQAIWPHALTMALVMVAIDLASRLRHGAHGPRRVILLAALAGACVGSAAGMRYQNIVMVGLVGLTLVWLRPRRLALAGYVLGCAIPITASAAINASRLGTWNPVSKGSMHYLDVGRKRTLVDTAEQAVTSTWARIVDLSTWPGATHDQAVRQAPSGSFRLLGGVKKALLQSAPWAVLSLLALLAAWLARTPSPARSSLRGWSVIVAGTLGLFAVWGFRDDGWCFNQRYLLELMPILCVTLGVALADWQPSWRGLAVGAGLGAALALLACVTEDTLGGQIAMMKVPIVIALAVALAYLRRGRGRRYALALAVALGVALGWAVMVHVADDLPASRRLRTLHAAKLAEFESVVPDDGKPIAVFAYWGAKDAYGPLLLERDIVIVDPWIDEGRDAPQLLDLLLRQGRIVYIERGMPAPMLAALVRDRRVRVGKFRWLLRIDP